MYRESYECNLIFAPIQVQASCSRAQEESRSSKLAAQEAGRKRQALERKVQDLTAGVAKAQQEKDFLKSLNDTLLANQKDFQQKLAAAQQAANAKDALIQDLQEQVGVHRWLLADRVRACCGTKK